MTVADYISRAESQSRQRPPLERTKPSEDALSGQKVGRQDVIYPTLPFFFSFGAGGKIKFPQEISLNCREGYVMELKLHLESWTI